MVPPAERTGYLVVRQDRVRDRYEFSVLRFDARGSKGDRLHDSLAVWPLDVVADVEVRVEY